MPRSYNPRHFSISASGVLSILSSLLTLIGDAIGAIGATTVTSLQGNEVSSATPDDGDVLIWNDGEEKWEPGALTAESTDSQPEPMNRSWPMAGGAHDYTLDAAFAKPTGYLAGGSEMSQLLGDGTDVPFFYVCARDKVATNGLTRTTTNRIRLQPVSTITTNSLYAAGNPGIVIPLPDCVLSSVRFTMVMKNFNTRERVSMSLCKAHVDIGSLPISWRRIEFQAQSTTSVREFRTGLGGGISGTDIDSYVSSNTCTRHYRFESDTLNAGLFGADVGATDNANTLILGSCQTPQSLDSRYFLIFTVGVSSGTFTAGFYGEFGNLTINGTRWFG